MTDTKTKLNPPEWNSDAALRERILDRAKTLTTEIIDRLTTAVADLTDGRHLAALGALDGIERELTTVCSILLLLS